MLYNEYNSLFRKKINLLLNEAATRQKKAKYRPEKYNFHTQYQVILKGNYTMNRKQQSRFDKDYEQYY